LIHFNTYKIISTFNLQARVKLTLRLAETLILPTDVMKDNIYSDCAIFQCHQCGYQTEIYSSVEYLPEELNSDCTLCNATSQTVWDTIVIERSDICQEVILHPQCASFEGCKSCKGEGPKHWTLISVLCPTCKAASMTFHEYTLGKHIATFKEYCLEWSKPRHPSLSFKDSEHTELFFLSGPYSVWSAT